MKIGFLVACHNKIDDLMIHLEAVKYIPYEHEVIIVHSMDYKKEYMEEIRKFHHVRIDVPGHYIGPLISATMGIRKAHELGLDYLVYANADDITYSFDFQKNVFELMEEKGYLCAGYNWLNVGAYHDITMNQLYFHVPSFYASVEDAEEYFKRSKPDFLCEYKMARWLKRTCDDLDKQFYRLPNREQEPGIGWERKDIYGAFISKGLQIPIGFWERLEDNNRFFSLEWQMIGSHDIGNRLNYWRRIRSQVVYGKQIEKEKHFLRLVDAVRNGGKWNLPGYPDKYIIKPKTNAKLISSKIL